MLLDAEMLWTALVPVKASVFAKSRLDHDQQTRARLSAAFLSDVLLALTQTLTIQDVLVVTDDPNLHLRLDPAIHIHLSAAKGLNPELAEGLRLIGHQAVAIIAADLPCVTTEALQATLQLAQACDRSFVTDAQGLGTTMLLARDAADCVPMFGRRSHARHAQAGYQEIQADSPATAALLTRVRRDVDTALDLWDAVRIGVGPASTEALATQQ